MADHPLYAMWRDRYEAELAAERERAARRAAREDQHEEWQRAWHEYKAHWGQGLRGRLPAWWNLRAWVRLLLGKSTKRGKSEEHARD